MTKLTERGPATVGLVVQEPVGGAMPGTAARTIESGLSFNPGSTLLMEFALQQTGTVGQIKNLLGCLNQVKRLPLLTEQWLVDQEASGRRLSPREFLPQTAVFCNNSISHPHSQPKHHQPPRGLTVETASGKKAPS